MPDGNLTGCYLSSISICAPAGDLHELDASSPTAERYSGGAAVEVTDRLHAGREADCRGRGTEYAVRVQRKHVPNWSPNTISLQPPFR